MFKGIKILFLASFILSSGDQYLWAASGEGTGMNDTAHPELVLSQEETRASFSHAERMKIARRISKAFAGGIGPFNIFPVVNILSLDPMKRTDYLEEIRKFIARRNRDVLIESRIVQVVLSEEYKAGIDWSAIVSNYRLLATDPTDSANNVKDVLSVGTISREDYSVLLEALEAVGTTHVLATSNVKISNNHEGKIVFSPESNGDDRHANKLVDAKNVFSPTTLLDLGMKLFFKPMIDQDNLITLSIKSGFEPLINSLEKEEQGLMSPANGVAETRVMIKNGGTIVIGGFIKDEKVGSVQKVPLLGDLPFIGSAFRNENQSTVRTELVVFLTPKIEDDHF